MIARSIAIVAAIITLSAPPSTQAEIPFVGVNAGAPIWGGSILVTSAVTDDIASSGCRFVRINFRIDGNTTWTESHLAKYDTIIANARNSGLEVLGLICYEAVHGSQSEWNQNYDTTGLNAYTTEFANNAWILINRFKDDVKLFEIWNEPDCWSINPNTNPLNPGGFYIWPKNYANILAETHKKCLTNGGSNFFTTNGISLVSAGLFAHDIGGSFSTSRSYMTNVYSQTSIWNSFESVAGRRYPWDYFGYHFYLNQGSAVSTSELTNYFNDIQTMRNNYNDDSQVLVTEFGWGSNYVGETRQADNLTASYDHLRNRSDVVGVMWYQWNNDTGAGWGLTYGIANPKPSYYAFASQCGVTGPPAANFSASPLAGTMPLTVQFTNLSAGQVDTYAWDFGDGATSTQASPSHTYTLAGTYTVALTATGTGGSDTETKTDLITVTAPPLGPDLDNDGDVDSDDLTRFLECVTGPDVTTPPAGCEIGSATLDEPLTNWVGADTVAELPESIATNDLIAGVSGTRENGGFHAATPGDTAGGLADLTDGAVGINLEAILLDFPGGETPNTADPLNRALVVRYDFSSPKHLDRIRVFAANETVPGDGRVFQNYDVHYSPAGDASFYPLIENVTTGPFGRSNAVPVSSPNYLGATITEVFGQSSQPAAMNVDAIRFTFYPVTNVGGMFLDEYNTGETGDTDTQPEAYTSSIIKEIDIFEFTGTLPVASSNIADFDGDDDVDQSDFGLFQRCFSGPDAPADPNCVN